jgi:hypothetical protein
MGTVYLNYGKIAIFWMQMHTDSQDLKENFDYRIRTPNVEGMHRHIHCPTDGWIVIPDLIRDPGL